MDLASIQATHNAAKKQRLQWTDSSSDAPPPIGIDSASKNEGN
jgi:hypothetical protein